MARRRGARSNQQTQARETEERNRSRNERAPGELNNPSHLLGTTDAPIHIIKVREGDEYFMKLWGVFWKISLWIFAFRGIMEILNKVHYEEDVKPSMESNITFKEVKGVDEAKAELEEIVHYLRDPERFTRLGGKLPKGVLLVGPPGTGKTMLARALAAEVGVPFFSSSGSEFEELYVGVGARRIRKLFSAAKKQSPCIIFIDELDALGGARSPDDPQRFRMTLNQLLIEMDGFKQNEGIVVLAATNFVESLDKALVRPGRFDCHVVVPKPDFEGRRQILEVHMSKVPRGGDVDLTIIARGTLGFSGAELANLVNSAVLKAAIDGAEEVTMAHLEYAKDKIILGTERKSAMISEKYRNLTAFHESGHAIAAIHVDGALPVYKATITPRGNSFGLVAQLPDMDEMSISQKQMLARLVVFMGGRVAEELTFGEDEVTSGASSDFEQATSLARAMVTKYGMGKDNGLVFLNYDDDATNLSSDTRLLIEKEVRRLLEMAYNNAKRIVMTHRKELHTVASALLEHETLTGSQIKALLSQINSQKQRMQNKLALAVH
ncbi:ATP-dependent zinc metalloprotease FTSH 5, mitochondrial isoform X1 [Hevea brasiliensis]|nr:ATP-dependent zinc metalloprotease FTSH 5, mitochondrial isoform X1 [Hevea brasiliensis]